MCRLLTERLGIGSISTWSEFQYHVTPPLFGLPFSSSFGYNVVTPWAFSLLHMRIIIASSISCLFLVVLSADWTDIGSFSVPLNPSLHYYHTYELQRCKI